jgi:transposase-like protein
MRRAPLICLSRDERLRLERLAKAPSTPQAKAFRCRIILRCGQPDRPASETVAQELGCDPDTVGKWRRRFRQRRLDGLDDLPRSGAPRLFSLPRTATA